MKKVKLIITLTLFAAAAGLIVFGIVEGGFFDVLNKAKMICFECIGIG